MARHLLIGAEASSADTAGVVTVGGIQIQKESANGPTALVLGESILDAPRIRFVQGHAEGNRFSPWINGRNIVDWSGRSEETPVAHRAVLDIGTQSNAAGSITLKFVRKGGPAPEFFKFTTAIANARSAANQAADVIAAYEAADLPEWLDKDLGSVENSDQIYFDGNVRGAATKSGGVWEEGPVPFDLIMEENTVGASVYTITNDSLSADPGVGDGNLLRKLEEDLQGIQFGYYDRLKLPKQPALAAVADTNYDVWNIVATKDGSTSSSINGVDNLIEIMIVNTAGSGTNALAFENSMNAYCGSVGFAPVTL